MSRLLPPYHHHRSLIEDRPLLGRRDRRFRAGGHFLQCLVKGREIGGTLFLGSWGMLLIWRGLRGASGSRLYRHRSQMAFGGRPGPAKSSSLALARRQIPHERPKQDVRIVSQERKILVAVPTTIFFGPYWRRIREGSGARPPARSFACGRVPCVVRGPPYIPRSPICTYLNLVIAVVIVVEAVGSPQFVRQSDKLGLGLCQHICLRDRDGRHFLTVQRHGPGAASLSCAIPMALVGIGPSSPSFP